MVNNYTFSRLGRSRTWVCSKIKRGCQAKVKMEYGTVRPYNLDHNHPPPNFHISKDGHTGGQILVVKGFTFSRWSRSKSWVCSKKSRGCPAKVKFEFDTVVPYNLEHNHEPPNFYVSKEGHLIKI
ncbi:hypothetical protein ABMA28_001421 [Loxostege sticticalis]|uniref:FLYWCH-type domain-containing protein n=1 Tax=Loxostege sticticalis TaxID=481309 RepID=A0ABD0T4D2_LOXSC